MRGKVNKLCKNLRSAVAENVGVISWSVKESASGKIIMDVTFQQQGRNLRFKRGPINKEQVQPKVKISENMMNMK